VYDNVNVTNPSLYGAAFGTSIDYAYSTTNQVYADDKSATMRAGKALGGTTTINGTQSTISANGHVTELFHRNGIYTCTSRGGMYFSEKSSLPVLEEHMSSV
jgi:hypothetical protein